MMICPECGLPFSALRPVHNDCEARRIDRQMMAAKLWVEDGEAWSHLADIKPITAPARTWWPSEHTNRHHKGMTDFDAQFLRSIGVQP